MKTLCQRKVELVQALGEDCPWLRYRVRRKVERDKAGRKQRHMQNTW